MRGSIPEQDKYLKSNGLVGGVYSSVRERMLGLQEVLGSIPRASIKEEKKKKKRAMDWYKLHLVTPDNRNIVHSGPVYHGLPYKEVPK